MARQSDHVSKVRRIITDIELETDVRHPNTFDVDKVRDYFANLKSAISDFEAHLEKEAASQ